MEHKEHKIMKTKTIKLKNYLKQINSNYENVRSTGEEKDFYTVIQPFVDEVYEFTDEWVEYAKNWIHKYKPKNLVVQQVESAFENIREICAQSFFAKTSYRRFKHTFHSINYTLEKLLTEISKKEAD
jgi:CRISPR/Cas system CSM-associated protein Csm2 small subunit